MSKKISTFLDIGNIERKGKRVSYATGLVIANKKIQRHSMYA